MALKRTTFFSKVLQPETVIVEGSFAPNGSGAVAAASNEGVGFSVARTATGIFEVTFSDKFPALISFWAMPMLSAFADTSLSIGPYTAPTETAKAKIVIRVNTAGAAADIAANASNRISFKAKFRNTRLVPTKGT